MTIEDYFIETLRYERKRTERSRTPFLLMLLNVNKLHLHENGSKIEIIRKVVSVLFTSTREIDIKGWYRQDAVIGVIFTEVNGVDESSVRQKIVQNLCQALGSDLADQVELSFHFFPEKTEDDQKPDRPPNLKLYPDLSNPTFARKSSLFMKRTLDIVGSVTGLILFSPLFLMIALFIRLSTAGPILFRQERIGLHGQKFTFLKFRSMHVNNDAHIHQEFVKNLILKNEAGGVGKGGIYKLQNDPRITRFGKFLRKTSLDELPQFFNVLKGEMSLVGPRPPLHYEVENYDLWHRRRVLEVKPGITGLWQVKGRSSTTFDEMVRLDLQYSREWSLLLDIKILFSTPWAVIHGRGAY